MSAGKFTEVDNSFKGLSIRSPAAPVLSDQLTLSDLLSCEDSLLDGKLMSFLRNEWQRLYLADELFSPLYPSKVIEEICLIVLKNWIRLERYFSSTCSYDSLHSGSNILITGPKGVGKTTLMKGLQSVIDIHKHKVRTIYLDYEQIVDSKILISSCLKDFAISKDFTSYNLDEHCKSKSYGVLFFGDEIQALYSDVSKVIAVRQILAIGKSHLAMGVISGSSSNVRDLAYKTDETRNVEYPNLNITVYTEKNLWPLRTEKEIQDALAAKKSNYSYDPLDLFLKTGGVGRYIDSALDGSIDHGDMLIKTLTTDKIFFSVMSAIYSEYEKGEVPSWTLKHITYQRLVTLEAIHFVNKWRNAGFLYVNSSNCYEFLIPNYLIQLREYFDIPDKQFLLAFQTTLRGWRGHGSAGQAIEPYIYERYIAEEIFPFKGKRFNREYLSYTPHSTTAVPEKTLIVLAECELSRLVNSITALHKDTGINGFIIEPYLNNDTAIKVIIIQIKTGERNKTIKKGRQSSTNSNENLTAILNNASHGFAILSDKLKTQFQREFVCSRYVLLTSKEVEDVVLDIKEVEINSSKVPFTCLYKETFDTVFDRELEECNLK